MFNTSMNFALGEEINELRDAVHKFAQDRIRPQAQKIDKDNEFPKELWSEMGNLGLHGITVSEEYGGSQMGYLAHTIALEEVSRASASVGRSCKSQGTLGSKPFSLPTGAWIVPFSNLYCRNPRCFT